MPRKTNFQDDLAALARNERSLLGEPPTVEELLAYRDGRLPEAEAERLRDRLAIDEELASLYLDLKREPDLATDDPPVDVDAAWRMVATRLEEAEPPAQAGEIEPPHPAPPRRRRVTWRLLAAAAVLLAAVGLIRWLGDRGPSLPAPDGGILISERRPPQPETGEGVSRGDPRTYRIAVPLEPLRGNELRIPADATALDFEIELPELDGPVLVRILDSKDELVTESLEPGLEAGLNTFRVPRSFLMEGRGYRLILHSVDHPADTPYPVDFRFRFVLVPASESPDPPEGASAPSASRPSSCDEIRAAVEAGRALLEENRWSDAETSYRQAANADVAKGPKTCAFQRARAGNGLALLASKAGRLRDSIRHARRGLELLTEAETPAEGGRREVDQLAATLEHNLAMAYFRLGWLADARAAVSRIETRQAAYRAEPEDVAGTLLLSARGARARGETARAGEAIRKALPLTGDEPSTLRASLWQEQARLDLEAGRLDQADTALERARRALEGLEDPASLANVLNDVAELRLRQRRWRESLEVNATALELAAGLDTPVLNLEAHARHLRSVALLHLGELDAARRVADAGLALLEIARRDLRDLGLDFFADRHQYFQHRLDVAMARDDPDDAWHVFESSRARGLLASLDEGAASTVSEPERKVRRALIAALRRLDAWDSQTGAGELDRLESDAWKLRREWRGLVARAPPDATPWTEPELERSASFLDEETLVLAFAGGIDRVHVLTLAASRDGTYTTGQTLDPDRRRLEETASRLLESLQPHAPAAERAAWTAVAGELGRELLEPLAKQLTGFRRLAIVAEGPLARLPFEILTAPAGGELLVESHEIVYLPSLAVLAGLRARSGSCPLPLGTLLAVGDPVFSSRDPRWPNDATDPRSGDEALVLGRLPGTADEVRAIQETYPRGATVLTGTDARLAPLVREAAGYRVLHIATHGRTDAELPERSSLALSPVDQDAQIHEPYDLYLPLVLDLELCRQTVVLSACDTARGRTVAGEGVLGLPRAFLHAGASAVVASLWQVPDRATARLMTAFHGRLQAGAPASAALRESKLESKASGDPATAWAAFVLLGDWATPFSTFP